MSTSIPAFYLPQAFCAVRPPGHHAGPKGIVNGHGFCIFNNVSVGASYAMNMYRDRVQRVAIVDFGSYCIHFIMIDEMIYDCSTIDKFIF